MTSRPLRIFLCLPAMTNPPHEAWIQAWLALGAKKDFALGRIDV